MSFICFDLIFSPCLKWGKIYSVALKQIFLRYYVHSISNIIIVSCEEKEEKKRRRYHLNMHKLSDEHCILV